MASGPCFRRNEMDRLVFQVPAEYDGAKLKGFLRGCARLSARLLTAAKRRPGGLLVNGRAATARTPVRQGDRVEVLLPAVPSAVPPEPLPLTAVYEDASLLVAEKPARMPMYPCPGHDRDSLANALSFYLRQRGETPEYHPVYRLDQDTTGLVVLAKDAYAASRLAGRVEKTYLALCTGRLEGKGTVEAPIGLLPGHTIQRCISPQGERAVTHWQALLPGEDFTLAAFRLETGRTHQIRVHMAHPGHPLLGDDMYGGSREKIGRQALHCARLSLAHPVTGQPLALASPLPGDMARLLPPGTFSGGFPEL